MDSNISVKPKPKHLLKDKRFRGDLTRVGTDIIFLFRLSRLFVFLTFSFLGGFWFGCTG